MNERKMSESKGYEASQRRVASNKSVAAGNNA